MPSCGRIVQCCCRELSARPWRSSRRGVGASPPHRWSRGRRELLLLAMRDAGFRNASAVRSPFASLPYALARIGNVQHRRGLGRFTHDGVNSMRNLKRLSAVTALALILPLAATTASFAQRGGGGGGGGGGGAAMGGGGGGGGHGGGGGGGMGGGFHGGGAPA